MAKLKILFVCGAGLGSSFACQMAAEDVLNKLGVTADIIITASNFETQFKKFSIDSEKTKIIYLKNIISKEEIENKLTPVLKEKQII